MNWIELKYDYRHSGLAMMIETITTTVLICLMSVAQKTAVNERL